MKTTKVWKLYTDSDDPEPKPFFQARFYDEEEAEHERAWAATRRPDRDHWIEEEEIEVTDDELPNRQQVRQLCRLLHSVLIELRAWAASEKGEQAFDLADGFHNLPTEMFDPAIWRWDYLEQDLSAYQKKYEGKVFRNYVELLREIRETPD